MPRQSRKTAKLASTPPQHAPANTTTLDFSVLKRAQLQQLCKKLGIRATGKNSELLKRLEAFHKDPLCETVNTNEENTKNEEKDQKLQAPLPPPPVALSKEIKSEVSETELIRGWCVVHGMVLYRPESSWFPLLLRGGMIYVQDGENYVSFNLPVTNLSVPEGLSDNYICEECVLRNQEKLKKHPMNQQIRGKSNQVSIAKDMNPRQDSTAQPSLLVTNTSRDKRRTIEIRKLYQPQEDEAYAQRVDGLLSLMARGELGMDLALRPVQPLVVHSPAPFERCERPRKMI
nr:developmental pluripotency-associated protein 4 [Anolis sagrei ordinatus]XP_060637770.1 developmental pluripotency-associated protein 4 [Anolis sagrei ordinatus]